MKTYTVSCLTTKNVTFSVAGDRKGVALIAEVIRHYRAGGRTFTIAKHTPKGGTTRVVRPEDAFLYSRAPYRFDARRMAEERATERAAANESFDPTQALADLAWLKQEIES